MIEVQNSIDGFIMNLKMYGSTINNESVGDLIFSSCNKPVLDKFGRRQYTYSIQSNNMDNTLVDKKEFILPCQLESHENEKDILYWDKDREEWCISKKVNSDSCEGKVIYPTPKIIRTGIADKTFFSLRSYQGYTCIKTGTKVSPVIECNFPHDIEGSNISLVENMEELKKIVESFENKVPIINQELYKLKVANYRADEFKKFDEEARKSEQERIDNYIFMTEDEQRRRDEANAHKSAESIRVANENIRIEQEQSRQQAIVNMETTFANKMGEFDAEFDTSVATKLEEVDTSLQQKLTSVQSQVDTKITEVDSKITDINNTKSDLVTNVNKKIEEVSKSESTLTSKVNSKITEVTTAKSEMVGNVTTAISKIDTTISTIQNQFNALAPEQSTNAEVQLARTDIEGVTHSSLNERLRKIETSPSIIWETIEG